MNREPSPPKAERCHQGLVVFVTQTPRGLPTAAAAARQARSVLGLVPVAAQRIPEISDYGEMPQVTTRENNAPVELPLRLWAAHGAYV